jgi:hypothetical protein
MTRLSGREENLHHGDTEARRKENLTQIREKVKNKTFETQRNGGSGGSEKGENRVSGKAGISPRRRGEEPGQRRKETFAADLRRWSQIRKNKTLDMGAARTRSNSPKGETA